VVLVEDDAPTARALRRLLEPELRVTHCPTAAGAFAALDADAVRAGIVVDLLLGDGCGLDVLARARRIHPDALLRVVSAHESPEQMNRAGELGAVWLCKPDVERALVAFARELVLREYIADSAVRTRVRTCVEDCELSARRTKILALEIAGLQRKEIASLVQAPEGTIKRDVHEILARLNERRAPTSNPRVLMFLKDYIAEVAPSRPPSSVLSR
jgi:DNA-binding NarL/FixJ family response regulator